MLVFNIFNICKIDTKPFNGLKILYMHCIMLITFGGAKSIIGLGKFNLKCKYIRELFL